MTFVYSTGASIRCCMLQCLTQKHGRQSNKHMFNGFLIWSETVTNVPTNYTPGHWPLSPVLHFFPISEHEIAGGGSEDSRSSTSPIDHFVTNNPRRSKVKRVEMKQQQHGSCYVSSTSGEEEEVDIGTMNDNELVFMTEQLSRLRTKEKKLWSTNTALGVC